MFTPPGNPKIGIIGLGYVGLPLAAEFGRQLPTVGFDISAKRIKALQQFNDKTMELTESELRQASQLSVTDRLNDLSHCNIYIVTVPTPIDKHKQPNLEPLITASKSVGSVISPGDLVIYESTVFPGATEDICVPILEKTSGLSHNNGFFTGYSPERINPGDKSRRISNIIKVTSGSTDEAAEFVDALYRRIVTVGTHKASSIKVAEAAKVIENTQRDVNIALVNELAMIFDRLDIDTLDVLDAAATKWNFLDFRPGLVGGHCIGVDPYYLTHKAQEIGYQPQVILSGRHVNDGMGSHVAEQVVKMMTRKKIHVVDSRVLLLGFTFKENCPDVRNTRVVDIVEELTHYNAIVDVFDPWVEIADAEKEYGLTPIETLTPETYDAIIVAVGHDSFIEMGVEAIHQLGKPQHILYDIKGLFPSEVVDSRL